MGKIRVFIILIIIMLITLPLDAASVHRVKEGEDIFKIAKEYEVTIKEVVNLNKLPDPNSIYHQQALIIPERENSYSYRVKRGESLAGIAKKLEIDSDKLALYNGLSNPDQIYERQLLYIPPKPSTYKVKEGDSLYSIAQNFEVDLQRLIEKNNLMEGEEIQPGDELIIPESYENSPSPEGPDYKRLYPDLLYMRGNSNQRKVTLTFDDGPDYKFTPRILDILDKKGVNATFFLIGNRIEKKPDVLKRIVRDGHIVANHTWSHPDLSRISDKKMDEELKRTSEIIKEKSGLKTAFVRPPYGALSHSLFDKVEDMGYKIINWSVDSRDWLVMDVDQILINTLPGVHQDAILLFHSAGGEGHDLSATVEVLAELIDTLRMLDYDIVNLDELTGFDPYFSG